jgi:tetratricopeptide (TPR) repeat protein
LDPSADALLAAASAALRAGRHAEARAQAARAVELHPDHPRAWLAHAELERDHGQLVAAHAALVRCLTLDPTRFDAAFMLAVVDDELGDAERSRSMLQRLHAARPGDAAVAAALAGSLERAGDADAAAALLQQALQRAPADPDLAYAAGRLARQRGELDQAAALLALAVGDATLAPLAQRELGWLHDSRGATREAIAAFDAANGAERARWQALHPGPNPWRERLARMRAVQTDAWYAAFVPLPAPAPLPFRPAFLVGFPRSGTTLLEQVVAAHPDCVTLEERPPIKRALRLLEAQPGGYPAALATLDVPARDAIRAEYAALVQAALGQSAPIAPGLLVLDKFPLRSADLAALARLFPEARILFAERDPRDVVLSCWMNGFRMNHEMQCFTDLGETVEVYAEVMGLAADAQRALAPALLRVRYERLLDGFDAEVGAVLAHLGLAWDDAVRDWAAAAKGRNIRTPSFAAVRGALHRAARERWRRYGDLLAPHQAALAPWIERLGYGGDEQ